MKNQGNWMIQFTLKTLFFNLILGLVLLGFSKESHSFEPDRKLMAAAKRAYVLDLKRERLPAEVVQPLKMKKSQSCRTQLKAFGDTSEFGKQAEASDALTVDLPVTALLDGFIPKRCLRKFR